MVAALLGSVIALAGCQDDDAPPRNKVVAVDQPAQIPNWLTSQDLMEPALWMRSREVGHPVLSIDPEVDRLRRGLRQASERFFEDERMIANRTVQASDMLAQSLQRERFVDVMTGLIDVADASPERKSYGQLCQLYLNLRHAGLDRTAALDRLSASYRAPKAATK